jgi:excisionase family DNA binding protein
VGEQPKYYTVSQAAKELGVSRWKMWKLLEAGEIQAEGNPLDKREKLIPAAEVERLSQFVSAKKEAA